MIQSFLAGSYWERGILRPVVEKAIQHSLCFGLYHEQQQIGFARVVTDYMSFAYIADVFVLEDYRGLGLGQWLIEVITAYPELQDIRRMLLATNDAQDFYRKNGFNSLEAPERWLEKLYERSWFKHE
jgi:GNAT superfamily N-acetyltransferase